MWGCGPFGGNMKTLRTILTTAMIAQLSLLAGCDLSTTDNKIHSLSSDVLSLSGEHGIQLSKNSWLHYGPESNIQVSNKAGQSIQSIPMMAEYLDHGKDEKGTFVFTIDEHAKPTLIRNNETLSIKQGEKISQPLEGMCLYQAKGGALQAFLMDESSIAHQVLIREAGNSIKLETLRTFPLPPGSEYCAVHNDTDQLFVSEENIGVWRYSARAESQVSRAVVDLVTPYGTLKENSGPLAVINDTLLIAEVGTALIHTKQIHNDVLLNGALYELNSNVELENLAASVITTSGAKTLTALDDKSGGLVQFELPIPDAQTTNNDIVNVPATGETQPVINQGDAADDPAIWVNKTHAKDSRIIGTNKKRGLYVYDLAGSQLQELLVDRVNNVDVRQGFTLNGKPADIAAASQRDRDAIALFHIHPETGLVSTANEITTGLNNVYGLCMYKGKSNRMYVYINDQDGRYEQWEITDSSQGWQGDLVRSFAVDSQPEGCTADETQHKLFVGEENKAVWALGAEPNDDIKMEMVAEIGHELKADIEGMELYQTDTKNILVVSSQGNDSYVLFEAKAPYQYLGRFRVGLNAELGVDGASETDGLTVSSVNFGNDYPKGMLVVQDGRNLMPMENQNFKLVSWESIEKILKL
jgi:3-phytase